MVKLSLPGVGVLDLEDVLDLRVGPPVAVVAISEGVTVTRAISHCITLMITTWDSRQTWATDPICQTHHSHRILRTFQTRQIQSISTCRHLKDRLLGPQLLHRQIHRHTNLVIKATFLRLQHIGKINHRRPILVLLS